MPELPEVTTTISGIRPYLEGAVIVRAEIRERRLRWPIVSDLEQRVAGRKVVDISRRGKYIVVHLDRGGLLVHLGMSGSFRIVDPQTKPERHDHFDLLTDAGPVVRYRDPRRFGCLIHCEGDPGSHERLSRLGMEPLEDGFTGMRLYRLGRIRNVPVKAYIMNSSVVVGVGNIYASESLFAAGISPVRRCSRISIARYDRLALSIRRILADSIAKGGTTLQDFVRADGRPGYFEQELSVYGRAGKPCMTCSHPIKSRVIAQRSTFYCPRCQT